MEKYVWSLDISTTNIGCALWDDKGKLIELKHLELKTDKDVPVEDRDMYKAEIFRKYCEDYKNYILNELNGEIIHTVVEAPLFGSTNQNTVALLLGFNGMCRYILFQIFNKYPQKIGIYEGRKLFLDELVKTTINKKGEKTETLSFPKEYIKDKKLYIWEKVYRLEPQIEWFYKKDGKPKDICFDLSDSYTTGYAYFKIIGLK
jgi:hypothetical protein